MSGIWSAAHGRTVTVLRTRVGPSRNGRTAFRSFGTESSVPKERVGMERRVKGPRAGESRCGIPLANTR